MKRRGFFGALAGVCVAPALAALPELDGLLPSVSRYELSEMQVARASAASAEFAEFQASIFRIIADGCRVPVAVVRSEFDRAFP